MEECKDWDFEERECKECGEKVTHYVEVYETFKGVKCEGCDAYWREYSCDISDISDENVEVDIMNKLGIPSKGVNFCCHCFEFQEHDVRVDESHEENVSVILTCTDCGQEIFIFDSKDTFYEYDVES